MLLAKTLKICIFLRENAYFQEIEDITNNQILQKIGEKTHIFGNVDFESILGGFWKVFGRPKSSIFEFCGTFFDENRYKIEVKKKSKKSKESGSRDLPPEI